MNKFWIRFLLIVFFMNFGTPLALAQQPTTPQNTYATPPYLTPTEYELLEPLPGVSTDKDGIDCAVKGDDGVSRPCATTNTYLPGLFRLMVMLATGLSVVMIIFAGMKYMTTDAFSGKEEAKGMIENALWGLFLAMSAWLILNTVNPKLVQIDLNIDPQPISPSGIPGVVELNLGGGSCSSVDCVPLAVEHYGAPRGCKAPGPCRIKAEVNTKLLALNKDFGKFLVTESYPPTYEHQNDCHNAGECVDVQSVSPNRIYEFLTKAAKADLDPVFEVETQTRKDQLIKAACGAGSAADCTTTLGKCIAVYPPKKQADGTTKRQITAEHFSVYNNSPTPCI